MEISSLSGLVPLEEGAVRGACGVSASGLKKTYLLSLPPHRQHRSPQAWESRDRSCPGEGRSLWSSGPGERCEVGVQAGGGG